MSLDLVYTKSISSANCQNITTLLKVLTNI